jgi:tetratricopeptide (TPR) repeat protein
MCISLFSQEYEEAKKSIVSLIDNLNSRNKLEMNNQNYDYIYKEIISKYDNTIKKLKKKKEEQKYINSLMEAAKYELDINRHKYLENQMKKIEKIKSVTQIDKMINEIYHNSTRGFEKGFIFDKSYKNYWEDIKKDYLKNLKKNNMKLVENYINRLGIFSQEPKDIGDKGYDIKYKYSIVKNIHYIDCNIEEFELSVYNDKFLGWVLFNDYSDSKYHFKFKMENVDTFSIDARGWSRLGLLYYDNKQYNKAIEYHLKAVKLEPNYKYNWFFLGIAYYENGQYEEAIKTFRKVLELDSNDEKAKGFLKYSIEKLNKK